MGKKKPKSAGEAPPKRKRRWTFLGNHALVALAIAQNSRILLREAAKRIGITERAVQRIVADLEQAGYLTRTRHGRSNWYELHLGRPLRHPQATRVTLGALLRLLKSPIEKSPIAKSTGEKVVSTNNKPAAAKPAAKAGGKRQLSARRKGATQR